MYFPGIYESTHGALKRLLKNGGAFCFFELFTLSKGK